MSTSLRMKQSGAWLALVTLASAAASANPHENQISKEKVNFADLNLNTIAGINVLYERITRAARLVCAPADSYRDHGEFTKCWRAAMDAAIAKVNNPLLTAVHESRQVGSTTARVASLQSPRLRNP